MPKAAKDPAAHFWARVDKSAGEQGCWLWTGYIRDDGYGQTRVFGTRQITAAHRYAFLLANGWLPRGNRRSDLLIRHTCDNRRCCNPAHLIAGTHKENTGDCRERGRWVYPERPTGLAAYRSKLSADDVLRARRLAAGGTTMASIAAELGVHLETARRAVKGQSYRDVPRAQIDDVIQGVG